MFAAYAPVAAAGPGGFLVAWQHGETGLRNAVNGARVAADGAVRDPNGVALLIDDQLFGGSQLALAFGGGRGLLAFTSNRLVANTSFRESDVEAIELAAGLRPGKRQLLTEAPSRQRGATVASDGNGFLLVWVDERDGARLYGTRVTGAGRMLDGAGVAISPPGVMEHGIGVAGGKDGYLVVWQSVDPQRTGIYAARFDAKAATVDPTPLRLAESGTRPAVAFDGKTWLAVWDSSEKIRGARVGLDGKKLDAAPVAIAERGTDPAIACGGGGCLVLWHESNSYYGGAVVRGKRLIDGKPEYAGDGRLYSEIGRYATFARVAWGRGGYFIVHGDQPGDGVDVDDRLLGVATDEVGAPRGAQVVPTGKGNAAIPVPMWDGGRFVVVYQHGKMVASSGIAGATSGGADLAEGLRPSIAVTRQGEVLAAWQAGDISRVHARLLGGGKPIAAEAQRPVATVELAPILARVAKHAAAPDPTTTAAALSGPPAAFAASISAAHAAAGSGCARTIPASRASSTSFHRPLRRCLLRLLAHPHADGSLRNLLVVHGRLPQTGRTRLLRRRRLPHAR